MVRVTKHRVEFARIESPKMTRLELDYLNDWGLPGGGNSQSPEDWKDALVKPVVRYLESDAARCEEETAKILASVRLNARHVFPTEKHVVRGNRARNDEVKVALSPLMAFRLWMDSRAEEADRLGRNGLEGFFSTHASGAGAEKCQPLAATRFKLGRIEVEDYIPFAGKSSAEVFEEGVYGIVGTYGDNARRSNRAGKSALLKAILTTLFGDDREELGRGKSAERDIHHGKERYRVALQILLDDVKIPELDIERQRGLKGKTLCMVDEAKMSITALNSYLEGLLRFTRDDFTKIAFVRAGDLHGIVGSGNVQMKADLLRWLGLEYWERIYASVNRELLQLEYDLAQRAVIAEQYRKERERLEGETQKHGNKEMMDLVLQKAREKADGLAGRIAEQRAARETSLLKTQREGLAERLRKEIAPVKFEDGTYSPGKLHSLLEERIVKMRKRRDELQGALTATRAKVEHKQDSEEKFRGDGCCPLESMLECPLKDRLVELLNARDADRKEQADLNAKAREKIILLEEGMRGLQRISKDAGDRDQRANSLRSQIEDIDEKLHGRTEEDGRVLDELSEELQIARDAVQLQEQKIADWKALGTQIAVARNHEQAATGWITANEHRGRQLRFIRRACGRDGIPTMQLENALSEVEVGANAVLELIEAPHRVAFSFQRELKVLEDSCGECGGTFDKSDKTCQHCGETRRNKRSEDISLEIMDSNGRVQDFAQDSSGGRALAALALRVALAQRFGFNVLFLDEVCGSLDDENLDMLIRLLKRLTTMGFDQVFVISHRQRVRELLEHLLVVERDSERGQSKFFLQG